MRKPCVILVFLVSGMLSFATLAHSYSGAEAVCLMASPIPTIDGTINENEWGEGIYLDKSVTLPGEGNYNGFGNCFTPDHIKDEEDCSGTLYFLWDRNFLYLAAKITDDDLYFDGSSPWENDCTEWRWNPDGQSDEQYIGIWITPEFEGKGPGWMIQDDFNGLDVTEAVPSLKVTVDKDGYEWEMKIPANAEILRDLELKAGNVVGFTVSIGENDEERDEYSMPCWSLNPDEWGWNEEFWGEMIFSSEAQTVEPAGKITATWGYIKAGY